MNVHSGLKKHSKPVTSKMPYRKPSDGVFLPYEIKEENLFQYRSFFGVGGKKLPPLNNSIPSTTEAMCQMMVIVGCLLACFSVVQLFLSRVRQLLNSVFSCNCPF